MTFHGYVDEYVWGMEKYLTGYEFKVERTRRGDDLKHVERLTGVSITTISRFERGSVDIKHSNWLKLVEYFNSSNDRIIQTNRNVVESNFLRNSGLLAKQPNEKFEEIYYRLDSLEKEVSELKLKHIKQYPLTPEQCSEAAWFRGVAKKGEDGITRIWTDGIMVSYDGRGNSLIDLEEGSEYEIQILKAPK